MFDVHFPSFFRTLKNPTLTNSINYANLLEKRRCGVDDIKRNSFDYFKLPFSCNTLNNKMSYALKNIVPSQNCTTLKVWIALLELP